MNLKLALANFGRLADISGLSDSTSIADTTTAMVRQSVIADVDLQYRWGKYTDNSFLAIFNTGFLFDAERDDALTSVPDASSYMFLGIGFESQFAQRTRLRVEALVGQSEVMSNKELFSSPWGDKDTLRFRPRVRLVLADGKFRKNPLLLGLWTDLGISDRYGDTWVFYVSRIFSGMEDSRADGK